MQVNDYVYVTKILPKELCQNILDVISKRDWSKHTWYNPTTETLTSEKTKELDVQPTDKKLQDMLTPYILEAGRQYNFKFKTTGEKTDQFINQFSPARFNRYEVGTVMRKHYDHIHSIFDGKRTGIPVLSMLGILNNGYEGGEFLVRDKDMNLKEGDMVIFPSCFMYPHEVKEVTMGTRYSFISWAF